MRIVDQLTVNLLDLVYDLRESDVSVIVGGGFGLVLKRRHIDAIGLRRLFDVLPEPRATNDLDIFLRAELLTDLKRTRELREAILRLGYTPVEDAKYLQWEREVMVADVPQRVKIDVLVGPLQQYRSKLKVTMPRVRPRGGIKFHAHAVEEALKLDEQPLSVEVEGTISTGATHCAQVAVPEAFPYLMMKIHAFADRKMDANKDFGRHHALDLYPIVGMMTEREYERAVRLGSEYSQDPNYHRAQKIVREDFSREIDTGILRVREHPLFNVDFQLLEFREVLQEIFPA